MISPPSYYDCDLGTVEEGDASDMWMREDTSMADRPRDERKPGRDNLVHLDRRLRVRGVRKPQSRRRSTPELLKSTNHRPAVGKACSVYEHLREDLRRRHRRRFGGWVKRRDYQGERFRIEWHAPPARKREGRQCESNVHTVEGKVQFYVAESQLAQADDGTRMHSPKGCYRGSRYACGRRTDNTDRERSLKRPA